MGKGKRERRQQGIVAGQRTVMVTPSVSVTPAAPVIRTREEVTDGNTRYTLINGVPVFGTHDDNTISQILRCAADERTVAASLQADGHFGYCMPIGGVIAYKDAVSPNAVGFDISCGVKGVQTNIRWDDIVADREAIFTAIKRTVVFGIGKTSGLAADHELFDDPTWNDLPELGRLKKLASEQLGTVGSGNHYVNLLVDDDGMVWITTHFGSRGLGHKTATGFLNLAAGKRFEDHGAGERMDASPAVIPLSTPLGQAYWAAMELAGRYAYAGRDHVVGQVLEILGAKETHSVHQHHNYCIAGTEKVATPNGYKCMQDITAGDTIYAFDPVTGLTETQVLEQWHSGEKEIYTITTGNRNIRVSGDHPILTVAVQQEPHPDRPWFSKGVGRYVWKHARELSVNDVVVCAETYSVAEHEAVREGLARFTGAFVGDGWVRNRAATRVQGYGVGLAIGNQDACHTARYLRLAEQLWPAARWKNNAPGAFGLSCSNKRVYEEICELGIAIPSRQRRLPPAVFRWNRSEKMKFLAGYIDADGSVADARTSNHGRGTICATSEGLANDLRELAIGLGLTITNVHREHRETNFGPSDVSRCVLSAGSTHRLPLWHAEKKAKTRATADRAHLRPAALGYLQLPAGSFGQRIRSIKVDRAEAVYDLRIEHPGHAFVCEGIVVHNCWKEVHNGEELMVVRKGATPAFPGQQGVIGGSAGDETAIVEGVDSGPSRATLFSTVHGAGRVMSRTRAAGKRRWVREREDGPKVPRIVAPGEVSAEMRDTWLAEQDVIGRLGLDESPHVYRRIREVLAAQGDTIVTKKLLRPKIVVMAGEDDEDPYKD